MQTAATKGAPWPYNTCTDQTVGFFVHSTYYDVSLCVCLALPFHTQSSDIVDSCEIVDGTPDSALRI